MRVAMLSRADLGKRNLRLDPGFYLGQAQAISTINAEGSRYVQLGDIIASIQDGARLPSSKTGIPMLRLSNVRPCELEMAALTLVDGAAAKWANVRAGDVLFTRAAQPFRAAAVQPGGPEQLAAASELTLIRPRPAVLPEYLAAVLCTPFFNQILRDLAYRGRASALPRLRLPDIQRLPIPLPSLSLQDSLREQYQQAVQLTAESRAEINTVVYAIHAEIDHRVPRMEPPRGAIEVRRSALPSRWDVTFNRGRAFRAVLSTSAAMRPLFEHAKPRASSLRGLNEDDDVFAIQADDVNGATFLVESGEPRPLSNLSPRMRLPLHAGDVLLCTTGAGDQVAYLDEEAGIEGLPILGSATFTALRFLETPRVFAVTLSHLLVRQQLHLLASGSVQRFVNKRDLDELLVPVLGEVWREDFEARLTRAMRNRREALVARTALIEAADDYLREAMP